MELSPFVNFFSDLIYSVAELLSVVILQPPKIEADSSSHAKPFDSAKHTAAEMHSEGGPTFDLGF